MNPGELESIRRQPAERAVDDPTDAEAVHDEHHAHQSRQDPGTV